MVRASLEAPVPKASLPQHIFDFVAAGCLKPHGRCQMTTSNVSFALVLGEDIEVPLIEDLSKKNFIASGVWCD